MKKIPLGEDICKQYTRNIIGDSTRLTYRFEYLQNPYGGDFCEEYIVSDESIITVTHLTVGDTYTISTILSDKDETAIKVLWNGTRAQFIDLIQSNR